MPPVIVPPGKICVLQVLAEHSNFKILPTMETELKIALSPLDVHMRYEVHAICRGLIVN